MTPQEMVAEFHHKFGCTVDSRNHTTLAHRFELVKEEYEELMAEFGKMFGKSWGGQDLEDLTKEMADLVYVVYGTAVAMGIDLDLAVKIVHESNMSKVWGDGKSHRRQDGKILKPPTYQVPDLGPAVKEL